MYQVETVADFFLNKAAMTPKKLQKLLYYAYSWHLVIMNEDGEDLSERLFENEIQAWVHGPVVPEIYFKYRDHGRNNIDQKESFDADKAFDCDTIDVLEQVWEVYGHYNGNELESISHQEKPWIEGRGDCGPIDICRTVINDATIFETYGARLNG